MGHTHAEAALEIAHSPKSKPVLNSKMVSIRTIIVLAIVVLAMAMTTEAAPSPMFLQQAFARARANDRGAGSFAGRAGRRIGGSAINPDPFAFPGQSPFPAVPLFI